MKPLQTLHKIHIGASQNMHQVSDNSVELVVTSPPYPMIEMWDEIMVKQNKTIGDALEKGNGQLAFDLMHQELDKIWAEVSRVLIKGGFVCINIGDATRTINGDFSLYSNHARIISAFNKLGINNLPNILWRKQTNAPNKFMGSGMLPSGAYVTLEHEWILVFRKDGKRTFKTPDEKLKRKQSAFFWEERNKWFSDLWELKGVKQNISDSETRKRSAAFPYEIAYRLINMYSLKGDTVLDPFLGTGTTAIAAMASQRNSIGYEIDSQFLDIIKDNVAKTPIVGLNNYTKFRLDSHRKFVVERLANEKNAPIKHYNNNMECEVMTSQETDMKLSYIDRIENFNDNDYIVTHKDSWIYEEPLNLKNKVETQLQVFEL
ncbi:DNA-methyltransferase [Mucilaginibacter angelicae]|uniref:Methyltransferase n=1 Tax=Mucilaginibacter angelicae TaxID=869718 RepID=A0ABV6L3M5_9SPHI